MGRGLRIGLPVLTVLALVLVALLSVTSPGRLASGSPARACTNTLAVVSNPDHPANAESLQAATAALHGVQFQTMGLTADYRQAIATTISPLHPAQLSTLGETLSDQGAARQFILGLFVLRKLSDQGIDTQGMMITGDYVCNRAH